jgi:hypothetical protein
MHGFLKAAAQWYEIGRLSQVNLSRMHACAMWFMRPPLQASNEPQTIRNLRGWPVGCVSG